MAKPVLYSFRRCPYAMRARMALHISETPVEMREILLRDKPAEMLAASPKGTVPVLVLNDGTVIDESLDIMRWALAANDPEGWLIGDDPELLHTIDGPFKHHLDRYKYATRHSTDPAEHRAAAYAILAGLDTRLSKQPFLAGTRRTIADIATFPFIRQFANTDPDWFAAQPIPALRAWLQDLVSSTLFSAIMVKHPPWEGP